MANGWQEVPLKEIAKPISRSVAVEAGTAYRTIGVKWWGMGAYERETIDGSRTAAKTLSIVREGDLIINKIWVRHGSVAIANKDVDGCAGSGEFPTFELDLNRIEPRWIHWQTKMKSFWEKCDGLSRGTSGKNRIKPELFLTIKTPLPPLEEQRRILEHIETVAAYIAKMQFLREKANTEAEATMPALLEKVFGELLANYPVCTLGTSGIAEVIAGQHIMAEDCNDEQSGFPYMTGPADFGAKFPKPTRWTNKPKVTCKNGDVLVTVKGAGVGKTNIAPQYETVIGRQLMAIRAIKNLITDFVYYFVNFSFQSIVGASTATTVPGVKKEDIEQLRIPQISEDEQRRIVAYLDSVQARLASLRELQAETQGELGALLPSVLDRAFKGEL